MDEYIKRKDAIKMIEEDLPEVVYYRKEDAIACLECLPAADVVPKSTLNVSQHLLSDAWKRIEQLDELCGESWAPKSEWISVEDRLPEEEGAYLVLIVDYLGEERMEVVELFKWANCFDWSSHMSSRWKDSNTITHWMPLPAPPTEKEN